jgi:MFS family permease
MEACIYYENTTFLSCHQIRCSLRPELFRQEILQTFRSLRYRNFRLYFIGQLVSLSGTWMQAVALSWLVYRMTRSPMALGIVECATLLPMLIFGLAGGWLSDKFDRRKVFLATQMLAMIQAVVLAVLTFSHQVQLWQAVLLAAVLGTLNAFEVPSRQALLVDLVDRDDLVNAVSLNSSVFSSARTIGPALAGILVSFAGEGFCFAVNAVSYLATIIAVSLISVEKQQKTEDSKNGSINVLDAIKYVMHDRLIRRVLFLAGMTTIFGWQYAVLMPIFASEILHGDARLLGLLRGCAGFGAFAAALVIASRGSGHFLEKAIAYFSLGLGVFLCAFAFSTSVWLSLFLAVCTGFFVTSILSGGQSLIQLQVDDNLRGRVMSIYMTVMLGISPVGSLLMGFMANRYGVQLTVFGCACVTIASGALYLLVRRAEVQRQA